MKKTILISMILILILTAACTEKEDQTTFFAAASLTEALDEYNKSIDNKLNLNFDSSTRLRLQIENGAGADIYLSANKKNVDLLREKKLLIESKKILENKMVIITPIDSKIETVEDLSKEIKLVIAEEEVPCGKYAVEVLENFNEKYGEDFSNKVMKNVVSKELNVKHVVSKIAMGEADAGIVYITDINQTNKEKLNIIEIEDKFNVNASYWICRLNNDEGTKKSYEDFLKDERIKNIFSDYGFKIIY